jgi:hypothetical protein
LTNIEKLFVVFKQGNLVTMLAVNDIKPGEFNLATHFYKFFSSDMNKKNQLVSAQKNTKIFFNAREIPARKIGHRQ